MGPCRMVEEKIKNKAKEIGFDLFGIASCEPSFYLDYFRKWIEEKRYGEMRYLADERRAYPLEVFPWAKSVVVLGVNYNPGEIPPPEGKVGRIARYAMVKDYHKVIKGMLKRLFEEIKSILPGVRGKYFVDSSPFFEKELGMRAGLGWIGKNTLLINPRFGSYFFLGEIVLDYPLSPTPKEFEGCGDCDLCIQACPTGALSPYSLDPRKCIAYLTTVKKGKVEYPGNFLYGCDICQEVCPWNKGREKSKIFKPIEELINPGVEDIMKISFKDTVIRRSLLLRNLEVVRRNHGMVEGLL
ncbi:tRNA epoxyqueuosine(34) reductase QueG [bacterium]|nr:MAG: tRNA epoxyqueuosine(34) reductase QueG [bacterium]